MYDDCRVLLNEELGNEIDNLSKLTPGTKEHTEAVEAVVKLYRAKLDEDELTRKSSEFDEKKETDLKESAKERKLKYGSVALSIKVCKFFSVQSNFFWLHTFTESFFYETGYSANNNCS